MVDNSLLTTWTLNLLRSFASGILCHLKLHPSSMSIKFYPATFQLPLTAIHHIPGHPFYSTKALYDAYPSVMNYAVSLLYPSNFLDIFISALPLLNNIIVITSPSEGLICLKPHAKCFHWITTFSSHKIYVKLFWSPFQSWGMKFQKVQSRTSYLYLSTWFRWLLLQEASSDLAGPGRQSSCF